MVNSQPKNNCPPQVFKTVQPADLFAPEVPQSALPLGVLKTLETQFQRRGFLRRLDRDPFYPLWFQAETERNVYLWRNGHSLTRQTDFEFWVDTDELIAKRLDQLESTADEAQFITAGFGLAVLDRDLAIKEREYLLTLGELLHKIQSHARALSQVGLIVEKEITSELSSRRRVVLPE